MPAKQKIALRIPADLHEQIKTLYPLDNCESQNEFMEKAIRFYIEYLHLQDASQLLTHSVLQGIHGVVHDSENRIARLLFKQAVEIGVLNHILAQHDEIPATVLARIRGAVVNELKHTNGTLNTGA